MSVYIKSVTIKNFRSVKDEEFDVAIPNGKPGSGLTVFVGPNNVGKTNVCRAVEALFNKFSEADKSFNEDAETLIRLEFTSTEFEKSIETYVQPDKQRVYKSYIESGNKVFAQRTDSESISKIFFKNAEGEFVNQSGIDAPFSKWMKFRSVTPELSTEEVTKYGSTSILGDLLNKIFQEIETEDKYEDLKTIFRDLFEEDSVFEKKSAEISKSVSSFVKNSYGEVGVNFKPERPDISQLTKNVKTIIEDGNHTSEISQKGSGLQRAVILALIQTYAQSFEKSEHKKPFYLVIDEPELSLSAQGQKKLLKALRVISQNEQIFLITHSPYFVNWLDVANGARIARASHDKSSGTKLHWLKENSEYMKLIGGAVKEWQKPYLLDTAAKEILFSDKTLLLEGQEDVGLISKWIREEGIEVDFDIFGYGVQGYNNFKPYLQLAKDVGLKKIAALYDQGEKELEQMNADKKLFNKYYLGQLLGDDIRDKFKPCCNCDKCRDDSRKCQNKLQYKDGCFDEHGKAKANSENYKDFKQHIQKIIDYMEG